MDFKSKIFWAPKNNPQGLCLILWHVFTTAPLVGLHLGYVVTYGAGKWFPTCVDPFMIVQGDCLSITQPLFL